MALYLCDYIVLIKPQIQSNKMRLYCRYTLCEIIFNTYNDYNNDMFRMYLI